jgi:outer membrane protein assembly factor BamB
MFTLNQPGRRRLLMPMFMACAIGALMPGAGRAAETAGEDWPQFRGPRLDNVSRETAWKSTFSPAGAKTAWSAQVGKGFSSIAIANGRAYTMGNSGGKESVFCFEVDSGKQVWQHTYPGDLIDNLHEGGPCSTPLVHDGKVYTLGKEGQLFCLAADSGKVVWQANVQKLIKVQLPQWGFTSSMFVDGDDLVLQAGSVVKINKTTGELTWQSNPPREPAYGSVQPITVGEQKLYATLNTFGVIVVDGKGFEVASFHWKTSFDTNATTPVVQGDKLFVSTGYDKGCVLLQLKGHELAAVYRNKKMRNHINNSVLYQGALFGFDGNSHRSELVDLACIDFATGEERWRHNGLGCGSLIVAGDKLVMLSDAGELAIAEAKTDKYTELSRGKVLDGRCWTVPTLSHGRLYARNADGKLVCVDLR